jgi:hypothetical protein
VQRVDNSEQEQHISALRRDFERDRAGAHFTCFTSTKVQILAHIGALRRDFERDRAGTQFTTQFTCVTGTKVQMQTLEELLRAVALPRLALPSTQATGFTEYASYWLY